MTRPYLTRGQMSTLKSRLTRAKKKGPPSAVVMEVHHAVTVFDEHVWPDNWANWQAALTDLPGLLWYSLDDVRDKDAANKVATVADEWATWELGPSGPGRGPA